MRITGGTFRSRTLNTSGFQGIRPTTDRARETMFNILLNYGDFAEKRVLDLCAGTGALSFEALSRGAASAVLVEKSRSNCQLLAESAKTFGVQERMRVICTDAVKAPSMLAPATFDIIFTDPPYSAKLVNALFQHLLPSGICAENCVFVAEHAVHEVVILQNGWEKLTERHFGETVVEFFRCHSPSPIL
ncbi:MAG: 16S rRNA (guanine(966)-N(2))-methyltransferase RsmD [Candidatus Kapabacteria bacterium]|jgi:16S rRNA (guanine966-N2)-methyltransferase|nr:16S rRNA (guanine(966)-N(2))-methyltransferase RsmD [Candidatus Kapabacteria bacterium]